MNNFIDELYAAFYRAGPPTYARLEELSKRHHNPDPTKGPRVLVLPHSTTHDILTRRHGRLPRWSWVVSFHYVLRIAAMENALDPDVIGSITDWHAMYQRALSAGREAARSRPPLAAPTPVASAPPQARRATDPPEPVDHGRRALSPPGQSLNAQPANLTPPPAMRAPMPSASATQPFDPLAATEDQRLSPVDELLERVRSGRPRRSSNSGGASSPAPIGRGNDPVPDAFGTEASLLPIGQPPAAPWQPGGENTAPGQQLKGIFSTPDPTAMQCRYLNEYGRTGLRLLRQAESDDGNARGEPAYRLATLLTCEHRPYEAMRWMERAARAGHALAERLAEDFNLAIFDKPPPYWSPAGAAFGIGQQYEAAKQPFAATLFFERAASRGHVAAAYRAGQLLLQSGRHWEAMLMFNRAARTGHEAARHQRDALLPLFHHAHDRAGPPSIGPQTPSITCSR